MNQNSMYAYYLPYKDRDMKDVGNFRSISVTSIIARLLEMAVDLQFSRFIEKHNILGPGQYGFRSESNTLFDLTSTACPARDEIKKTRKRHLTQKKRICLTLTFDYNKIRTVT